MFTHNSDLNISVSFVKIQSLRSARAKLYQFYYNLSNVQDYQHIAKEETETVFIIKIALRHETQCKHVELLFRFFQ